MKSGALDFFMGNTTKEMANGINQLRNPSETARFQRNILASTPRIVSNSPGRRQGICHRGKVENHGVTCVMASGIQLPGKGVDAGVQVARLAQGASN
jgi:hypothetical protein